MKTILRWMKKLRDVKNLPLYLRIDDDGSCSLHSEITDEILIDTPDIFNNFSYFVGYLKRLYFKDYK